MRFSGIRGSWVLHIEVIIARMHIVSSDASKSVDNFVDM